MAKRIEKPKIDIDGLVAEVLRAGRLRDLPAKRRATNSPIQSSKAKAKAKAKAKPLTLAKPQQMEGFTAEVGKQDYERLIEILRWAVDESERRQDRDYTISWSYAPLDGRWYVWTLDHDTESQSLAMAIKRFMDSHETRRQS